MDSTDAKLLQRYVEGSQEAFAELVRLHLNLVYSAARRQTRSPEMAEEVAQSVFIALARHAAALKPGTPLAAWLHLTTRHLAINAARDEDRRRAREHAAYELSAMPSSSPDWNQLAPLLDESVALLPEADRAAILLRFFEGRSLREVGASLGISDDAAQKRVSRALEQLRSLLRGRGVPVTAAALATGLSAHAIEAAPAALGDTIASGPSFAALAAGAVGTGSILVMTTFQKAALTATLAVVLGLSLFEAQLLRRQRGALDAERAAAGQSQVRFAGLRAERDSLRTRIVAVRQQIAATEAIAAGARASDPALEAALRAWVAREDVLRQTLEENPHWKIPELSVLAAKDWSTVAETAEVGTPEQVRKALGELRTKAVQAYARKVQVALKAHAAANDGMLPSAPAELAPYFAHPEDAAMLARYRMLRTGKLLDSTFPDGRAYDSPSMIEVDQVDYEYDTVHRFGTGGASWGRAIDVWGSDANAAFARANGGRNATSVAELLPYFPQPVNPALVERLIKR